jgi:hypothetical protein
MEDGTFYGHLVYFTAIWYILWPFLVYFFPFWYVVARKIWQPRIEILKPQKHFIQKTFFRVGSSRQQEKGGSPRFCCELG